MFRNRLHAGLELAAKLKKYQHGPGVVLAIPRGGVPVAYVVARQLALPLDISLTKKIGHPLNKEYAIGAASLDSYFITPGNEVPATYVEQEVEKIRARLKEMHKKFMGGKSPEKLEGKTVIVIDDGIATGNTILATIHLLRKSKLGKIVIAAPVASKSALELLAKEADDVIVLLVPDRFNSVGSFYENFTQVTDKEAMYYLENWNISATTGPANHEHFL